MKHGTILATFAISFALLAGCSNPPEPENTKTDEKPKNRPNAIYSISKGTTVDPGCTEDNPHCKGDKK